jgi:hypothetical protein
MTDARYAAFIEGLTSKLSAAGVPAMPSWPDAIDWLIERARREWCGLCGGYGAWNPVSKEAVPCMACGRKSEGMVLIACDVIEVGDDPPQTGGLRLIEGGNVPTASAPHQSQRKPGVSTSPHRFRPLRWWDAFRGPGRCRHCLLPRDAHPIHYWAPARALGDKTKAELTWENLHG